MSLVIKSNASQATDVTIADMGIVVLAAGSSVTLTENEEFRSAIESAALRAYLVDDAHGAGSSTLILNDGTGDIAQADASQFLTNLNIDSTTGAFRVVQTNASNQVDKSIAFDGTATVSSLKAGTDIDANSFKITNLAAPTAAGDAVNKAYADALAGGLDPKDSVRVATTANLAATRASNTLTASANASINTAGIDGVTTLALNDRILVKDQSTGADNGIYTITDLGSAGTPWVMVRATDFDTSTEVTGGAHTFVSEGTANGDSGWVLTTNDPITLNTTSLSFTQFSGLGQITAGAGLTKSANTLNVGAGNGIVVNADDVAADYGAAGDMAATGLAAANSAGVGTKLARIDHAHTHGDRGADGSSSQHDADQVDVEATLSVIGAPASVEAVMSNINGLFDGGRKAGRIVDLGITSSVPSSGTRHYMMAGGVLGSAVGMRMVRASRVTAAGIQVNVIDASRAFKLSIQKSIDGGATWSEVGSVALATSTLGNQDTSLSISFAQGDLIRGVLLRTSGSGASTFSNSHATIEFIST
jgi:hypothetical protein